MLKELSIYNFALIEELIINFTYGFNIITGKTGSGKSIILDSIEFLCGNKSNNLLIRNENKSTIISGYFKLSKEIINKINNLNLIKCEEELYMYREINTIEDNKCKINFKTVPLYIYKKIGYFLFDFYTKGSEQSIMDPKKQLELLDGFLSEKGKKALLEANYLFKKIKQIEEDIGKFNENDEKQKELVDYYKYSINEIENISLNSEEEFEKLKEEKNKLINSEKLFQKGKIIYHYLFKEEGVIENLNNIISLFKEIIYLDKTLIKEYKTIEDFFYNLTDFSNKFKNYFNSLKYDEKSLNLIDDRIYSLNNLKKKFGNSICLILRKKEEMKEIISKINLKNITIRKLNKEKEKNLSTYIKVTNILTSERKKSKIIIEKLIKESLEDLEIYGDSFKIKFQNIEESIKGKEKIEFYFNTNKGEKMQPLRKIISSGELSRIMLAFKKVFVDLDYIQSFAFDEVDSGIGGNLLFKVAKIFCSISKNKQVICVTHSPIIASFSDTHFYINKCEDGKRVVIRIKKLNTFDQKNNEIARMLGGKENLNLALKQSKEIILFAIKEKKV